MIKFSDIKDKHIAIHFNNRKELDALVDFLKNEGYVFGTGQNNDLNRLKEYPLSYFVSTDNQYISLDRSKKFCENNFVSCGLGYNDFVFEFKDIQFIYSKKDINNISQLSYYFEKGQDVLMNNFCDILYSEENQKKLGTITVAEIGIMLNQAIEKSTFDKSVDNIRKINNDIEKEENISLFDSEHCNKYIDEEIEISEETIER